MPIKTFNLISKSNANGPAAKSDFERITLHFGCYRAAKKQSSFGIIVGWTENDGWTVFRLLMAYLWIEIQPNSIPYVRNLGADHQKISLPTGLPKSASP